MLLLDVSPKPHMIYPAIPVSEQAELVADDCDSVTLDDNTSAGCPILLVVGATLVLIVPLMYVKSSVPEGAVAILVSRIVVAEWVTTEVESGLLLDSVTAVATTVDGFSLIDVLVVATPLVVGAGLVVCCVGFGIELDTVVVGVFTAIAVGEGEVDLPGFVSEVVIGPVSSFEVEVTVRYATVCTAEAAQTGICVVQY